MSANFSRDVIWLVDDDIVDHALNREILDQELPQINKVGFTNPKEALEALKEMGQNDRAPQFIFLDLFMPELNAMEFIEIFDRDIHPKFPATKIVLMDCSEGHAFESIHYPYIFAKMSKPLKRIDIQRVKQDILNLRF